MLIIQFHNDNTGDEQIGNYDVSTYINSERVWFGRIKGHERKDWRDLIIMFAEQLKKEQYGENGL
jgi:hypothetical protein